MLVLTRRAGESIMIDDDVRVVVLEVRGDTVRLGIEAPRSVQVHRAEVYAEVRAANAAAATSTDLAAAAAALSQLQRGGAVTPPRPRQSTDDAVGASASRPVPKPGPPKKS